MAWLFDILQVLHGMGVLGLMFAARNEYTKLKAKENGDTNRNGK